MGCLYYTKWCKYWREKDEGERWLWPKEGEPSQLALMNSRSVTRKNKKRQARPRQIVQVVEGPSRQ